MTKTLVVDYSLTGVVDRVAQEIADQLGADQYRLQPTTLYSHEMWQAWDQAQAETAAHQLPGLSGELPDLTMYDQIILGGPVWGASLSNPLRAYLERTDFQGKSVAAFWTYYDHDENYQATLQTYLNHAQYQGGLDLTMSVLRHAQKLESTLQQWTQELVAK